MNRPRHCWPAPWLLALLLIGLSSAPSRRAACATPTELTVGGGYLMQLALAPLTSSWLLDLGWHRTVAGSGFLSAVELGGGLRVGPPPALALAPLEAFADVRLRARLGPWRPRIGVELGVSGLQTLPHQLSLNGIPQPLIGLASYHATPLYLAFNTAPLCFQLGRFTIDALQLQLGTAPVSGFSHRLQIELLQLGFAL